MRFLRIRPCRAQDTTRRSSSHRFDVEGNFATHYEFRALDIISRALFHSSGSHHYIRRGIYQSASKPVVLIVIVYGSAMMTILP